MYLWIHETKKSHRDIYAAPRLVLKSQPHLCEEMIAPPFTRRRMSHESLLTHAFIRGLPLSVPHPLMKTLFLYSKWLCYLCPGARLCDLISMSAASPPKPPRAAAPFHVSNVLVCIFRWSFGTFFFCLFVKYTCFRQIHQIPTRSTKFEEMFCLDPSIEILRFVINIGS